MTSANERWTQRIMGGLGVRPVGGSDPLDDDQGAQVPITPQPTPPAAPQQSSTILSDWWRSQQTSVGSQKPAAPAAPPNPAPTAPAAPAPPVEDEDEDEETEDPGESAQPSRRTWNRPTLGRPKGLPPKRQNLFTWWGSVEPQTKWLMYHGTGLAGGIWIGAFGWGFDGRKYVTTHDTSSVNVIATYAIGALILAFDYRVRNWFPLVAWAARGLSTSIVIGALWYSTPLSH